MSSTSIVDIFDLPHRRARALLATGAPVFLTVDPVEYHGPHLPLNNDRIMSAAVVRALHAGLSSGRAEQPLIRADALPLGVEPAQGPGTRVSPYRVVKDLCASACSALADLGARGIVVVTGHGSPLHSIAIQHAVRALTRRGIRAVAPFNVILHALMDLPATVLADAVATVPEHERDALRRSILRDFHAGFGETSLMLHWAPHVVDAVHLELPDVDLSVPDAAAHRAARIAQALGRVQLAKELDFAFYGLAWAKMRPFPGYTGRPRLANAEAGAVLARFAEARMLEATRAVVEDGAAPPEPPMLWLERASLSGRIRGLSTPPSAVQVWS